MGSLTCSGGKLQCHLHASCACVTWRETDEDGTYYRSRKPSAAEHEANPGSPCIVDRLECRCASRFPSGKYAQLDVASVFRSDPGYVVFLVTNTELGDKQSWKQCILECRAVMASKNGT